MNEHRVKFSFLSILILFIAWVFPDFQQSALSAATSAEAGPVLKLDFRPTALQQRLAGKKFVKQIAVSSAAKSPVIDGRLDDAAWQQIAQFSDFDRPAPVTTVKAALSDEALYLAVRADEPDGYKPGARRAATEHDTANIWRDDSIEFWVGQTGVPRPPLHLIVNRAGAKWDALGNDSKTDVEWQSAVRADEKGWSLEVALPRESTLKLLGGAPAQWPPTLGFDVARNSPTYPGISWSGAHGDIGRGMLRLGTVAVKTDKSASAGKVTMQLHFPTDELVAGGRFLRGAIRIAPEPALQRALQLEARLYAPDATSPLVQTTTREVSSRGQIEIDLQGMKADEARLQLVLRDSGTPGTDPLAVVEHRISRQVVPQSTSLKRVRLDLETPKGVKLQPRTPVTLGFPLPAGAMQEISNLRVVNAKGRPVPAQFEIMARWAPGGDVKWVRVDTLASSGEELFVESGAASPSTPTLTLQKSDDTITIDTGAARYVLGLGSSPIRGIWRDGQLRATAAESRGLFVVNQNNRLASASAKNEKMTVESSGPLTATIKFEGAYETAEGEELARHITYVEAFAGRSDVKVLHTLIYSRDTREIWFNEIGWEMAVPNASRALFATSASKVGNVVEVPLAGKRGAVILQEEHYALGHGENRFSLSTINAQNQLEPLNKGEEMGDWAAVLGAKGGVLFGCLDAARQHPKAFEINDGKFRIDLFSARGGKPLDFRMPALMKQWNFDEWVKLSNQRGGFGHITPAEIEKFRQYPNNAIGGAKTHELMFDAIATSTSPRELDERVRLRLQKVSARPDPAWTYQTRALNGNHPRDVKRFPEAELALDKVMDFWLAQDATWGENGFLDYFGGPHITYIDGRTPVLFRYTLPNYNMRADLWLVWARGADRRVRDFAAGTNRARMDNAYMHHGPRRGFFRADSGMTSKVPIYWNEQFLLNGMENEAMNHFIWYHYLTGDRRARDVVLEYADALKKNWTPELARRAWRVTDLVGLCAQMYAFTEDHAFAELAEATLDLIEQPVGKVRLTRRAYNSTTYKNHQDVLSLLDAWKILRWPRLREMCLALGTSEQDFPYDAVGYTPEGAELGRFLYDETGDRAQVQSVLQAVHNAGGLYDPQSKSLNTAAIDGTENLSFVMKLGYALDLLNRAEVESAQGRAASWALVNDLSGDATIIVRKPSLDQAILLHTRGARLTGIEPFGMKQRIGSEGVNFADAKLLSIRVRKDNLGEAEIPWDVPAGDYELTFDGAAKRAFASTRVPLVIKSSGLIGLPSQQEPATRYVFEVAAEAKKPRIYFTHPSRLYKPDGSELGATPVQGWVELPAMPGLWSFTLGRGGCVRLGEGLLPLIGCSGPEMFFRPTGVEMIGAADAVEYPAIALPAPQALAVETPAAEPLLDSASGTIEFFVRPNWSSFLLKPEQERALVASPNLLFAAVRDGNIRSSLTAEIDGKPVSLRTHRPGTIIPADSWTHIALVWDVVGAAAGQPHLEFHIFVNGQRGSSAPSSDIPTNFKQQATVKLNRLFFGGVTPENAIDAMLGPVRISDVARYHGDFQPPGIDLQWRPDKHTRLLLQTGNLQERQGAVAESTKLSVRR